VGSFLNVVIYRLPRDKSLVNPPSTCPACDKQIRFYDNIPLISWLILGARCRYCKARIFAAIFRCGTFCPRCFFVGVFALYFVVEYRRLGIEAPTGIGKFLAGGWLFYLTSMMLLAALLAASAIDLELWVIPLPVCWFVTGAGVISASIGVYLIDPAVIWTYKLWPSASVSTAAMAVGASAGLVISLVLLSAGILKRSYQSDTGEDSPTSDNQQNFHHRREVLKEVVFLLPIIVGAAVALWLSKCTSFGRGWWLNFSQLPVVAGFLGSLWGYFVGCGVVWTTRILGTLGFGKEAMGMGDVHLMGAAGAVIGPIFVIIAFFIAPFFGLLWAGLQMFFKKTRQIPYGPFLSLAIFVVMIFHDRLRDYLANLYVYH